MARLSISDRYYISSFVFTCAGIAIGLGLIFWLSFTFEWLPWALLALAIIIVAWFYGADKAKDKSIIHPSALIDKPHENINKP